MATTCLGEPKDKYYFVQHIDANNANFVNEIE